MRMRRVRVVGLARCFVVYTQHGVCITKTEDTRLALADTDTAAILISIRFRTTLPHQSLGFFFFTNTCEKF